MSTIKYYRFRCAKSTTSRSFCFQVVLLFMVRQKCFQSLKLQQQVKTINIYLFIFFAIGQGITNPYGQTKYMVEQILKDVAISDPVSGGNFKCF